MCVCVCAHLNQRSQKRVILIMLHHAHPSLRSCLLHRHHLKTRRELIHGAASEWGWLEQRREQGRSGHKISERDQL